MLPEKGAESRIAVAAPRDNPKLDRSEKLEGDTTGVEYLKKIIMSCRERGIDVLLTYLPSPRARSIKKTQTGFTISPGNTVSTISISWIWMLLTMTRTVMIPALI